MLSLLRFGFLGGGEIEHTHDRQFGAFGNRGVDGDFVVACADFFERVDYALQAVHRHPRAVRAAFTGGGFAGGGGFDEGVRRVFLMQLVQHAIIGGDDEGVAVGELRRAVENG